MIDGTDISVLSFDVSHNCLGRAHMLAEVLSRRFRVEIVGPATSPSGVWLPCRRTDIPVKWVPQSGFLGISAIKKLLGMVNGKVIYAIKPRLTSYGIGLWTKRRRGTKLVIDIDDWELGFYRERLREALKWDFTQPGNPNNLLTTWLMEKVIYKADAVTVSSSYLGTRFGGLRVPHCRDTDKLDPALFDRDKIREQYSWSDKVVVIFLGTPAPYKGIDVLVEAARVVANPRLKVVIAGVPLQSSLWKLNRETEGGLFEVIGQLPLAEVPKLLAAADIAVTPQLASPATRGQVPAKLVDAMAMAKAIVASAVSDIPEMIHGCGLLVQPGDPRGLADAITTLIADRSLRQELGLKARRRCLENYSYNAIEEPLAQLFFRVGGLQRRAA